MGEHSTVAFCQRGPFLSEPPLPDFFDWRYQRHTLMRLTSNSRATEAKTTLPLANKAGGLFSPLFEGLEIVRSQCAGQP